jgi:hypothetical protein
MDCPDDEVPLGESKSSKFVLAPTRRVTVQGQVWVPAVFDSKHSAYWGRAFHSGRQRH